MFGSCLRGARNGPPDWWRLSSSRNAFEPRTAAAASSPPAAPSTVISHGGTLDVRRGAPDDQGSEFEQRTASFLAAHRALLVARHEEAAAAAAVKQREREVWAEFQALRVVVAAAISETEPPAAAALDSALPDDDVVAAAAVVVVAGGSEAVQATPPITLVVEPLAPPPPPRRGAEVVELAAADAGEISGTESLGRIHPAPEDPESDGNTYWVRRLIRGHCDVDELRSIYDLGIGFVTPQKDENGMRHSDIQALHSALQADAGEGNGPESLGIIHPAPEDQEIDCDVDELRSIYDLGVGFVTPQKDEHGIRHSEFQAPHNALQADADVVAEEGNEDDEEVSPAAFRAARDVDVALGAEGAAALDADAAEMNGPEIPAGRPAPEDQESDDDPHIVRPIVNGFGEAVRILEDVDDQSPIDWLYVFHWGNGEGGRDEDELEGDEPTNFHQFVTRLGRREGSRIVRRVIFMTDWRALRDEDIERLFRDVLPGHPTLQFIGINIREIPTEFLRMLTDNVPTEMGAWPLTHLMFDADDAFQEDRDVLSENVQAIVDMLNRNAAISGLFIFAKALDAELCKLICKALPCSTNLRLLCINVGDLLADTLEGVGTSSLRTLNVTGSFSDDAVVSLAKSLRTNETLQHLLLHDHGGNDIRDSQALLDLVRTYNYTLLNIDVSLSSQGDNVLQERLLGQVQECTRRNGRVRNLLQELQDRSRPVVSKELLRHVLVPVSNRPTVVYRILRKVYAPAS